MTFAHPEILILLFVTVPALSGFLWWSWRKKQQLIGRFVRSRFLAELTVGVSKPRQKVRIALIVSVVALLLVALARPQWGFAWQEVNQRGLDVILAIDTSRSLLAEDVKPNRFQRTKLAAWELIHLLKTDRIGLVAFAGNAFVQTPLTVDKDALRQSLDAIQIGIIPQEGSALADAIRVSESALDAKNKNHRVIVLFTDGEDHEGGAIEMTRYVAKKGLRIFTIGLGTNQGELIPLPSKDGQRAFVKDRDGNVVKSRLNDSLLKQIAALGNGFYLPLARANTIELLYQRGLAPLPKSDISARMVQRFHERFYWPLGLAIALLMMDLFMPDRRRAVRRDQTAPRRSSAASALMLWALILAGPFKAMGSPAEAARLYRQGDYLAAFEEYQKLLRANPDDARLLFNTGAAAYQVGKFQAAVEAYQAVLMSEDLDLQQRAYYNLGNAFYLQGKNRADPDQTITLWQRSLKVPESAVQLNNTDEDAQFNLQYIRKKLQALKNQQGDQPPPGEERDEDSQDPKEKESREQESPDQKNPKSESQEKSPGIEQPQTPQDGDQQPNSEPAQQETDDSASEPEASKLAVPMTPEQARQLLESIRSQESAISYAPTNRPTRGFRGNKKW